jgi:hypothetical protein
MDSLFNFRILGAGKIKYRNSIVAVFLGIFLQFAMIAEAFAREDQPRSEGMQCFFAGHSFFCPVALSFDRIAKKSDFPEHEMKIVFRGGASGTAGALWNSPKARKEIEAVLASGNVELFGLTPGPSDTAETFEPWFDLALEHNPDTCFFIGIPWAMGGHSMKTAMFEKVIDNYAKMGGEVVKELRKRYPNNRIDYLSYGKMAPAMKRRFEAERLPDIDAMVGKGRSALFADDRLGHAGPMLLDLCALTWLNELYAADLDSLTYRKHESDVGAMVQEVMTFNEPFRAESTSIVEDEAAVEVDAKPAEAS